MATFPPDVRHQSFFLELQQEARQFGRGLWAESHPSSVYGNGLFPVTHQYAYSSTDGAASNRNIAAT